MLGFTPDQGIIGLVLAGFLLLVGIYIGAHHAKDVKRHTRQLVGWLGRMAHRTAKALRRAFSLNDTEPGKGWLVILIALVLTACGVIPSPF